MRFTIPAMTLLAISACAPTPSGMPRHAEPRDVPALLREAARSVDFDGRARPPEGSIPARAVYAEAMMEHLLQHGVNVGVSVRGTALALAFADAGICDERLLRAAADMLRGPLRWPGFTELACAQEGVSVGLGPVASQ